jgi:hypothetical protein
MSSKGSPLRMRLKATSEGLGLALIFDPQDNQPNRCRFAPTVCWCAPLIVAKAGARVDADLVLEKGSKAKHGTVVTSIAQPPKNPGSMTLAAVLMRSASKKMASNQRSA